MFAGGLGGGPDGPIMVGLPVGPLNPLGASCLGAGAPTLGAVGLVELREYSVSLGSSCGSLIKTEEAKNTKKITEQTITVKSAVIKIVLI